MIEREIVRQRPPGAAFAPNAVDGVSDAAIAAELDAIVGKSRRRSPLRRRLRRIGGAVAGWFDRLVPPAPPQGDTEPPEIRFPFF
jgi:hypothetical protein